MITNYPPYAKEEIDFIREFYPDHTAKETVEEFNKRFEKQITLSGLKHRCHKFGIKSNDNYRFKKGNKPWNKGIDLKIERPDLYEIQAERMRNLTHENDSGCVYTLPIGTESVQKRETLIKLGRNNWVLKQRYVYEKAHNVKLKDDEFIIFLDGNKNNFDIDNLMKVDRKIVLRSARQIGSTDNSELRKTYIAIAQLKQAIADLEEENERD